MQKAALGAVKTITLDVEVGAFLCLVFALVDGLGRGVLVFLLGLLRLGLGYGGVVVVLPAVISVILVTSILVVVHGDLLLKVLHQVVVEHL